MLLLWPYISVRGCCAHFSANARRDVTLMLTQTLGMAARDAALSSSVGRPSFLESRMEVTPTTLEPLRCTFIPTKVTSFPP
jgi:hypothetical protein